MTCNTTEIALTFADYLDKRNKDARRYDQLRPETILFIEEIERVSGTLVTLICTPLRPALGHRPPPRLSSP